MPDDASPSPLIVTPAENDMKLLRFLERRLAEAVPRSALHKWIRTGQVRVNGGRAKAHARLVRGDLVRLPPFALARALGEGGEADLPAPIAWRELGADLPVVARTRDLLVLAKPGGLACQSGSGRADSVASRLAAVFAGRAYIPAPAHRLDRDTSGLVLAGLNHEAQRRLHELFRNGGIVKEYLAWVAGDWPEARPCLLEDVLEWRRNASGRERAAAMPERAVTRAIEPGDVPAVTVPGPGQALCAVMPVLRLSGPTVPPSLPKAGETATLLIVRLFTGRRHQIRVQLASRGYPLIGDNRYAGPRFPRMLLHCHALRVPASGRDEEGAEEGGTGSGGGRPDPALEFRLPPDWPAPFAPDPAALEKAGLELRAALDA